MNRRIIGTMVGLLLLIGDASAAVWAQDGPPGRRGRMGPPPEAIKACLDKDEGTVVEVTTPRGDTLKATCKQMGRQLVAVPNDRVRGQKGNPPDDADSKQ
jgi:hypothetical protein